MKARLNAGYSKVMRIVLGAEPSVRKVGILTAENPNATQQTRAKNRALNAELLANFREMGYGPIKIKGKFAGNVENSFLVPGLTRAQTAELGQIYGQEAVLWGTKAFGRMSWQYIEGDTTIEKVSFAVGSGLTQNRPDFYSSKKGRKFLIPFFEGLSGDAGYTRRLSVLGPKNRRRDSSGRFT